MDLYTEREGQAMCVMSGLTARLCMTNRTL